MAKDDAEALKELGRSVSYAGGKRPKPAQADDDDDDDEPEGRGDGMGDEIMDAVTGLTQRMDALRSRLDSIERKDAAARVAARRDAGETKEHLEARAKSLMEQAEAALKAKDRAEYDRLWAEGQRAASRAQRMTK